MKRNFSQLLFTAGTAAGGSNTAYTATFGNNINLNAGGTNTTYTSVIGASAVGTVITLTGTLSGNADLQNHIGVSGGQGVIVLNPTTANTYTGATRILTATNGVLRIGKDDALPTGTALIFGGTQGSDGSFDLNGNDQTIASLSSTNNTATGPTANRGYIGGVVNNTPSLATLTIDGSAVTKYDGSIGSPPSAVTLRTNAAGATQTLTFDANLPNASSNVRLQFAGTNKGTLVLTNANNVNVPNVNNDPPPADQAIFANNYAGSDYTGGTIINGGRLVAANTVGSVTGAGTVTVGAGGTLASAGGNLGVIAGHVTSSGTITPGVQLPTGLGGTALPASATGTNFGTMTLNGGLTLQSGANVNFKVAAGANANDKITLGGATDPDILTLPGTAQSVNFNIVDLAGNITGPNTYTLLSYPVSTTLPGLDTTNAGPIKVVPPVAGLGILATYALTNNTVDHTIDLSVSGLFGRKIGWRGDAGTGSGTWDINTTSNFDNAGSPSTYLDPDEVTFDDTTTLGTGDVVVDIVAGGVTPANIIVNNATRKYTIQGGAIQSGGVTKNGGGTLVLSGTNTYAGGTVVNGTGATSTLEIAGDSSLGAVPATPQVNLTLNKIGAGGSVILKFDNPTTLHANRNILITQSNGGGGTFDTNGNDVTIAGQILSGTPTGGVNLVKQGTGVLTLTGDNSTSAGGGQIVGTLINGGSIKASADVNLGRIGGGLVLNGGGLIYGSSFDLPGRGITIASGGGTIDTAGFNSNLNGAVISTGTLTKQGLGTLVLSGTNTHTGTVSVTGGVLQAARIASLPEAATPASITVAPGATLAVNVGGAGEFGTSEVTSLQTTQSFQADSLLGFDTTNAPGGTFPYGISVAGAYGINKLGTGTLTLSVGNAYTGPTLVTAGTLVAGDGDALPTGAMSVAAGGTAQLQASLSKAATVASVTTAGSGKLDITNNSAVMKNMSVAAVQAEIVKAFNAGQWNGNGGITSSTAATASPAVTAIGFASNGILNKSEFKGVTGLDADDVLVKYTYYGDSDLNGATTLDDYTLFLNGYQTAGNTWVQGDYDYNGLVTLDDFTLFLAGYQQQGAPLTALQSMINNTPMSSADRAAMLAAVQAVPEPASMAVLGLGAAAGLLGRRRRRSA
jgi:autotransporter-associated beta strand protein